MPFTFYRLALESRAFYNGRMQPLRLLMPLLLGLAACRPGIGSETASSPVLSVYLPDYRVKADTVPLLYGTSQLILFAAKVGPDGSVDFSRIDDDLLAFARKARKTGRPIKITVCVGGWGNSKDFASAVSTAAHRGRFVKDLSAFCDTHALDGVDLDWEFPKGDKEHGDFGLFIQSLSTELRSDNRLLTIALGYTRPLAPELWPYLDYVNLMSYQPWSIQDYDAWLKASVKRFLETGLPPEKLLLGVGFFAREKSGDRRAISWKTQIGGAPPGLPDSEHGFWTHGKPACDLRVRMVEEHGLGGVMVWDYGHDSPDPEQSLLRHLSRKLSLDPTKAAKLPDQKGISSPSSSP